jgi:hypothetical protein
MLTNERLGRLAFSSIAAVIGGIVLLDICGKPLRAMLLWLVYVVVCAVLLNSERGEPAKVITRLAILPALIPLLVLSYPAIFLEEGVCFSGVRLTGKDWKFIAGFCIFLASASWAGITLFAFCRNRILEVLTAGAKQSTVTKLKTIDAALRASIAIVGSLSLLYLAVVGRDADSELESAKYRKGIQAKDVASETALPSDQ